MNTSLRNKGGRWAGLLILLPVLLLAGVGIQSLRQDRILARHAARERAQFLADALRDQIWQSITRPTRPQASYMFRVTTEGRLIFPSAYPAVPVPIPLTLEELNPEQRKFWESLPSTTNPADQDDAMRESAVLEFLGSDPPDTLAAWARYRWGQSLARQGQLPKAVKIFEDLLRLYPGEKGETGLPLAPVVSLKLLEWERSISREEPGAGELTVWLDRFCSNAISHPSFLTPHFLSLAMDTARGTESNRVMDWKTVWDAHEFARQLYAAAQEQFDRGAATRRNPLRDEPAFPPVFRMSLAEAGIVVPAKADISEPAPRRHSVREWPPPVTPLASNVIAQERVTRLVSHDGSYRFFPNPTEWFAVRVTQDTNTATYHCWRAREMAKWFARKVESPGFPSSPRFVFSADLAPHTGAIGREETTNLDVSVLQDAPTYLGASLDILGRAVPDERKGSPILASAAQTQGGVELWKVNVHLLDARQLFAAQRTRTIWFGLLIGLAVTAICLGYTAVWRAWRRQERLSAMKSNFVSSVSHELRAPIASVRLLAEGLEDGEVTEAPKQQEYFHLIVQECRRLSSMVENVLNFSRIEEGRKEYEFESTDMVQLTSATVKLMAPCAAEQGVTIEFSDRSRKDAKLSSAPPLHPRVDAQALQQALINLIDNAVKHSSRGSVVLVTLDLNGETPKPTPMEQPASGETPHMLRLSVSDQGPGVPPSERKNIFQRFYRVGSEMRRSTPGVGIGLSIVRHVVEAHHGRVWVEDAPEKGSCFVIELPLENQGEQTETRA